MTTSLRAGTVAPSEQQHQLQLLHPHQPFPADGGSSSSPRGSYGTLMPSPPHSGGESYYEGYDSDCSHPNLAGSSKSNDRESRKKAEKQRRTVLNNYIGQLASLVPLVAESTKKVDKTSILRLAAHDLRVDHVFGDSIKSCHSDVGPAAADAFLDLLGGFLLTITVKGVIVVISSNVLSYLGHTQIDMLGQNLISFTHPEDVDCLRENLTFVHHDMQSSPSLCSASSSSSSGASSASTSEPRLERRDFLVRLARAGSRSDPVQYSVCRLDGAFRRSDRAGMAGVLHPIRRQRVRKDRAISPSGNDFVFVGVVRVLDNSVIPDRLLEASKQEYWTRHLVDGRIVHCDQRISLVAGYMSEEVTGVSAFTFMHKEDVRWVVIALRQMYDDNKPYGESCYRLVSRTGQFMYLRTKGFLEIDRTTKAAQSFVCINSLVSDEHGMQMITDMRRRYSAIIDLDESDDSLQLNENDDMGVEDPRQLEQVIIHLISNLPSPGGARMRRPSMAALTSESDSSPQYSPCPPNEPLTIIPPTPSAVKSSIVKSISVMSLSGALKRAGISPSSPRDHSHFKRMCRNRVQHSSESDKDYG